MVFLLMQFVASPEVLKLRIGASLVAFNSVSLANVAFSERLQLQNWRRNGAGAWSGFTIIGTLQGYQI